jgi:AraC-binding-like domain
MASNAINFAPVRFSTSALPERERLPMCEEFGRQIVRVDIEPLSDDSSFHADATLRALPGLRTVTCTGSATRFEHTPAQAADGDQSMTLFVNVGRKAAISVRGREMTLNNGDAVLVSPDPAAIAASDGYLGVHIPRQVLASRVDDLDGAIMRPIPRGNVPLRLLTSYLTQLSGYNLGAPELRRTVATHIQDLAALIVGANRAARGGGHGRRCGGAPRRRTRRHRDQLR